MDVDLLSRLDAKEGEQKKKSDAGRSTLVRLFEKYQNEYQNRTVEHHEQLAKTLADEQIRQDIGSAWSANNDVVKQNFLTALNEKLNETYANHFKKAQTELTDGVTNANRETKIITSLHAIRRFYGLMIVGIRDLHLTDGPMKSLDDAENSKKEADEKLVEAASLANQNSEDGDLRAAAAAATQARENADNEEKLAKEAREERQRTVDTAKTAVSDAETSLSEAEEGVKENQDALESARRAERSALCETTRVVREALMKIVTGRRDAVADYETAIMFIGDVARQ